MNYKEYGLESKKDHRKSLAKICKTRREMAVFSFSFSTFSDKRLAVPV